MSWSILDVPTFRGPCSPLHQGEEQPDTELFLQVLPFYVTLLVEVGVFWWWREGEVRVMGETDSGILVGLCWSGGWSSISYLCYSHYPCLDC